MPQELTTHLYNHAAFWRVYINGQPLGEPYLGPGTTTGPLPRQSVPVDHYFVMGDLRSNSQDSRFYGSIPKTYVLAKVHRTPC